MHTTSAVEHDLHLAEEHVHEREIGFLRKYVFSTDHKTIGRQFLFATLLFFIVGGLLALMVRWQLAWPGRPLPLGKLLPPSMAPGGIMLPEFYNALFTMHASVMIFFVIIPMLVGAFGNFVVPLQIGARDMAFPRINMLSYWIFWPAAIIALAGFFVEGGAMGGGWTAYPPLSVITPGIGINCWLIAVFLVGFSSILGGMNYITTIVNMRAPGMSFFRMPLTVWAIFITSVLSVLATPVLTAAIGMVFLDRVVGTSFFLPAGLVVSEVPFHGGTGNPLLFQHLFWFYSHPAVYIMILPGMGVVSDVLAVGARKPIFGYRAMVFSMAAIAGLGFIVWGHHMFQSGMNPTLGTTFMVSTMFIAVPSAIKTFNWLGTLWRGDLRFTTAMCFAVAFVSMFVIGGLSGIFMASTAVDVYIHDTYFIVAHIHYVLFGGSVMAIFAGIYHWFPKMFGRRLNETWGKVHFWTTLISFNGVFFPMHIVGVGGMMRRIYDPTQYEHLRHLQPLNVLMTISAFVLGVAQIPFAVNFLLSLVRGRRAETNPWRATTLEWQTTSPPLPENFEEIPAVYHGPYEYSSPLTDEDWLPQNRDIGSAPRPATADEPVHAH
jgi:cytochrome c oxidase subunit 1